MLLFFIVLPPVSFRPLSGSYISQLNSHICSLNVCGLFPSPIGELHFSILDIRETERVEYTVSVPYRGATFLNIFCKYVKNTDYRVSVPYRGATFLNQRYLDMKMFPQRFRPLSGSYISQSANLAFDFNPVGFPSPIGELHFSIRNENATGNNNPSFRPLSGSYISQSFLMLQAHTCICFRPLSGSYISQSMTVLYRR